MRRSSSSLESFEAASSVSEDALESVDNEFRTEEEEAPELTPDEVKGESPLASPLSSPPSSSSLESNKNSSADKVKVAEVESFLIVVAGGGVVDGPAGEGLVKVLDVDAVAHPPGRREARIGARSLCSSPFRRRKDAP